jgi:hypothetical protein
LEVDINTLVIVNAIREAITISGNNKTVWYNRFLGSFNSLHPSFSNLLCVSSLKSLNPFLIIIIIHSSLLYTDNLVLCFSYSRFWQKVVIHLV